MREATMLARAAVAAIAAPARSRMALAPTVYHQNAVRSLHATGSDLRKKQPAQPIEEDEFENEEEEVDLFESSGSSSTTSDRTARRSSLISEISSLKEVDSAERRSAIAAMRIGTLRKIISLSDSPEELEQLRSVLRSWRWAGKRVTTQTAKELIGRCCNLGRPDLALEFSEDRLTYGLPPLPVTSLSKLHHALLSQPDMTQLPTLDTSRAISPTLAILRLALLSRQGAPAPETETLVSKVKNGAKDSLAAPEWRAQGLKMLEAAGGSWAEAGRKLQAEAA